MNEPMGSQGRTVIVTGGSRGIGFAIADRFIKRGDRVLIVARKEAGLVAAAGALGPSAESLVANVGKVDDIGLVVEHAMHLWGRIDILVNNAAASPYVGRLIDVPLELWHKTHAVNVVAPLLLIQQVWHASMKDHGGQVINICSIGGLRSASGGLGVYDSSKAALIDLTKRLAIELAPSTRVNGVAPGLVVTEMARELVDTKGPAIAAATPMQRLGSPEDIASACLFLASAEASWITGEVLVVDGGRHLAGASASTFDRSDSSRATPECS